MSYYESGTPAIEHDFGYSRRYRRYGWDDDDFDEQAGGEYEMEEVFESYVEVESWRTVDGKSATLGDVSIHLREVIAQSAFTQREPDDTEYEGFMGNYGPTLDRWYHRAALVIWPRENSIELLIQSGPSSSVPDFIKQVNALSALRNSGDADRLRMG